MPAGREEARPPKRRKTKQDQNFIYLGEGKKPISLESWLAPPSATDNLESKTSTVTTDSNAPASATKPTTSKSSASSPKASISKPKSDSAGKRRGHGKAGGDSGGGGLLKIRQALPIWQYRSDIQTAVRTSEGHALILVGETGSGKSTQVPQFLFQQPWCKRRKVRIGDAKEESHVGGTIAITQPRRVAAVTLAHRVAQEAGTPLGKGQEGLVGYSVRFDHNVPRGTKIKFLTEGMLLQELLRDPNLRQYSAVIVDEIHERSLDVDLLTGFLKRILNGDKAGRGGVPLKVVIMSATADVGVIQRFLDPSTVDENNSSVRVLRIKGRQFPVETVHEAKPVPDIQDALVNRIMKIHVEEKLPGDILAFLIGQDEIESAQKLIEEYAESLPSNVPKVKVLPLYGQLSMELQREAFLPVKATFTRKIVLATNIAETSVTVPGIKYVVDSGKAKVKQFRARVGMESLLAKPISKSSAVQRTGRAGREGPGKCFRLYTEESFRSLQDNDLPEILRNDILGAVLTMKARGIQNVRSFPLMDAPDGEAIDRALGQLYSIGALDSDGTITESGHKMARFPITASLGAVLLAAAKPEFDCVLEVIDIISCLTAGEDIFLQLRSEEAQEQYGEVRKQLQRREGDLITYLTTMQQYTAENADRTAWCRERRINLRNMRQALNIRRQLRGLTLKEGLLNADDVLPDPQPFVPIQPDKAETVLKCFLRGFASKTAMLEPDGSYVTCLGKHVVSIHPSSVLHGQKKEAIMFLEYVYTTKNYSKKVSAIQAVWIEEALLAREASA